MKITLLLLVLFVQVFLVAVPNQIPTLSPLTVSNVVDSLCKVIETDYYFTDRIPTILNSYKEHKSAGDYENISNPHELADRLTKDFQDVYKDLHFRVMYNPEQTKQAMGSPRNMGCGSDQESERRNNYGFKKVEILSGNIGYIRWDSFSTKYEAYQLASSALNFVSNTDALIIDMRYNGGGSASMVQFISTYLFDENLMPVLLNLKDSRNWIISLQNWTLPFVPGKRMADIPVYILISRYTGSAAEAFSYSLRNVQRATLVGETTAGAAHPVSFHNLGDGFTGVIPNGLITNPLTKTDWEGVGVDPDIAVESSKAFDKAYKTILDSLSATTVDSDMKYKIEWAKDGLALKEGGYEIKTKELADYAGQYGQRTVIYKNNQLFYKRTDKETKMIPISKDKFVLAEIDNFRIRFERDNNGKIISLTGLYEEGREDNSPKTK